MAYSFNPPPGWPAPPPGWEPPEGWQPDPSWPAPPEGWQFWVEDAGASAPTSHAPAPASYAPSPSAGGEGTDPYTPQSAAPPGPPGQVWDGAQAAGAGGAVVETSGGSRTGLWVALVAVAVLVVGGLVLLGTLLIRGGGDPQADPEPAAPPTSAPTQPEETAEPAEPGADEDGADEDTDESDAPAATGPPVENGGVMEPGQHISPGYGALGTLEITYEGLSTDRECAEDVLGPEGSWVFLRFSLESDYENAFFSTSAFTGIDADGRTVDSASLGAGAYLCEDSEDPLPIDRPSQGEWSGWFAFDVDDSMTQLEYRQELGGSARWYIELP